MANVAPMELTTNQINANRFQILVFRENLHFCRQKETFFASLADFIPQIKILNFFAVQNFIFILMVMPALKALLAIVNGTLSMVASVISALLAITYQPLHLGSNVATMDSTIQASLVYKFHCIIAYRAMTIQHVYNV